MRTEGVQKRSWGYLHSLRRSGCSLSRVLDRRVAYVRVLMAVKLGEQAWRSSLLQSSQWQLRIMAERNGEYILTVPVPLESVWRRFFGGQLWIRANISRQELNKFLEISQGGGVLSKDPNHLWISLCQGASRLVGGLGGDESVAFTTLMPLLFYKYYCKADEGRRSHWRWWRDFFCGSDVDGCHEPAPQIYRRHEFDVEFGRMEPDGVIYTPWEDQGGYGAVLWQHIASILSGMARNLVEHSGEMAMKGGDAILQWGQAVATYLSMDECFQAISALHALQFQEEVEDMTEYPHLQAMVQRMTDREKFYAIQQSRGMGLYPSDEMKFMHSLVKQISTKCRRKEMEVMEREQKKANEQASISNLAIVNKTVELELQMRASTLDLMMADHYNRQERGLKEKMKVWTDTLSPSLNKCLLQHILRSASNVILALYATQSFTSSQDPIDQAEMKEHPERYHLRTNSAMGKFVESAEEYLVLITLWHVRSVASKLDH